MDREFDSQHILNVHGEPRKWPSHRVGVPVGDRERLQVDQAIHGRHDVEALRPAVFLLRVRVSAVLDWRAVDLLVQVALTGEYEHPPIVTADNTLTLLKKNRNRIVTGPTPCIAASEWLCCRKSPKFVYMVEIPAKLTVWSGIRADFDHWIGRNHASQPRYTRCRLNLETHVLI